MNLLFWGMTAGVIGKAMLAYGVVLVHIKMAKERAIDDVVIQSFKTEMIITIIGLCLIIFGYILEVSFLGGFAYLMHCSGSECAAAIGAALQL